MDRVQRTRPTTWLALFVAVVMSVFFAGAVFDWTQNHEAASLGLVTVGATLALALGAILTIRQNDSLIKAAIDEASAATEQARVSALQAEASNATLAEMQMQRQFAYRPWLVYAGRRTTQGSWGYQYVVKNVGTGPAVNVVLSGVLLSKRDDGSSERVFLSATIPGLAAGDEWAPWNDWGTDLAHSRHRCMTDDLALNLVEEEPLFATRYEDWFGNYFRSPGSSSDVKPAAYSGNPSSAEAPDWLRCS